MTYIPEWARESSPTASLSNDAMLKYYKDHSVAGWCRFYLENPGDTSPDLLQAIQALAQSCQLKQKPAHKAEREALARRWQAEAYARNTRTVPRLAPAGNHVTMWGWDPKPRIPEPTPAKVLKPLAFTPQTISFNPAKILARYERRRIAA